jgi:hypothetical protein
MDPVRFLDLAKVLKGGTAAAENDRTAIGRAYYGAFDVGIEALKDIGIQPSQSLCGKPISAPEGASVHSPGRQPCLLPTLRLEW